MGAFEKLGVALALAIAVMAGSVAGCGSARPPTRVHAQYLGPIGSRDVARGEHIFRTLCAACHRGRVNPAGYHWTAPQMRHQIREGNALMPALPPHRLADDRVEAVLAYLSTIGAIDGGLPLDPDAPVDEVAEDEELAALEGELEGELDDELEEEAFEDELERTLEDELEEDEPLRESGAALADPTLPAGDPAQSAGN